MRQAVPRAAVGSGSHVFTVSEFVRDAYVGSGIARSDASSVVYNIMPSEPIDEKAELEARRLVEDCNGPLIVFAGRLTDGKGLSMLVEAMPHVLRQIPETTLLVAGGGDLPGTVTRA